MRAGLQIKISGFLVGVLVVAFGVSTGISWRLLRGSADREVRNIFQSLETGTKGSLERGEMEMFQSLLVDLAKIPGVREIGLADPAGKVSYSSVKERVGQPLDAAAFRSTVAGGTEVAQIEGNGAIQLLRAHHMAENCLSCHDEAKVGDLAGVLFVRYDLGALRSAEALTIATGLGGLAAAAVGVYLLLGKLVRRPLVRLIGRVGEMASGDADLTQRLPVTTSDEMGDVARGFNAFVEHLQGLVGQVLATARDVSQGNAEIAAVSQKMLHQATEQSHRSQNAATSAEEMSATVLQVAKGAQQAAEVARSATATAEMGSRVVEQGVTGMGKVERGVSAIAATVRELGQRSRAIGEVMQVIDDIADQTNLLALNAAIEAARAGEHGRGFAVVADEVRKLSEKTADATRQVRDTVTAILTETEHAVESVTVGVEEANRSGALSRQAGEALKEIVAKIAENSSMVAQIATATEQQSAAVDEISQNVDSIATLARDVATGVEQTSDTAAGLQVKSAQLLELMGRFKV